LLSLRISAGITLTDILLQAGSATGAEDIPRRGVLKLHAEMKKGRLHAFPSEYGAGNETRTRDLYLGKVSLYQLSYSRKKRNPHEMESDLTGGAIQSRTGLTGFAIRGITALLSRQGQTGYIIQKLWES
jgi:hypothetical protein